MGCGSSVLAHSSSTTRPRALSSEDSLDEVYNSRSKFKPVVWKEPPNDKGKDVDKINKDTQNQSNKEEEENKDGAEQKDSTGSDENTSSDPKIILKQPSLREELKPDTLVTSSLPPIKSALAKPQKSLESDPFINAPPSSERTLLTVPSSHNPFTLSVSPRVPPPRTQSSSAILPLSPLPLPATPLTPLTPLSPLSPLSPASNADEVPSPHTRSSLSSSADSRTLSFSSGTPLTPTFFGTKPRSLSFSSSASRSFSSVSSLAPIAPTTAFSSPSRHLPSPSLHPSSSSVAYSFLHPSSSLPSPSLIPSPSDSRFISKSAALNLHVQTQEPRKHRLVRSSDAQTTQQLRNAEVSVNSPPLYPAPLKRDIPRKMSEPTLPASYIRELGMPSPISPSVIVPDMGLESPSIVPEFALPNQPPTNNPPLPTPKNEQTDKMETITEITKVEEKFNIEDKPKEDDKRKDNIPNDTTPKTDTSPKLNDNVDKKDDKPQKEKPAKVQGLQNAPSGLTEAMGRLQRLLEQRDTRSQLVERGILKAEGEVYNAVGAQKQLDSFLASRLPQDELLRRGILPCAEAQAT